VLGQPIVRSSVWLEPKSDSDEPSERGPWMNRSLDQSLVQVTGDALSSEGAEASSAVGATTAAKDMMGLETDPGGGSRSTCYPLVLGVTMEVMSRGPYITDVECREPD
jgi:hypothetical protein